MAQQPLLELREALVGVQHLEQVHHVEHRLLLLHAVPCRQETKICSCVAPLASAD